MRVGVFRDTSTGAFTWHDGSDITSTIPTAFWRYRTVPTSNQFGTVERGLIDMPSSYSKLGYLCELNDPCKYLASVFTAAAELLTSYANCSSNSIRLIVLIYYK